MLRQKALGSALAVAVIAIALPGLAIAQDEQEQASQTQRGDDELICTTEPVTGSRIPRRVCRTQAEIDQDREDAREFIGRSRERTAQNDRRTN